MAIQPQWASYNDLIVRYDVRVINELSGDLNDGAPNLTVINILLKDASAEVMQNCLVGEIYIQDDLQALYDAGDYGLIKLVCDITLKNLFQRRANGFPDNLKDRFEYMQSVLRSLKNGDKVFNTININNNLTSAHPEKIRLTYQNYYCEESLMIIPFWNGIGGTNGYGY